MTTRLMSHGQVFLAADEPGDTYSLLPHRGHVFRVAQSQTIVFHLFRAARCHTMDTYLEVRSVFHM